MSMYDLNMRLITAVEELNKACDELMEASIYAAKTKYWYERHHAGALLAVGSAAKNQGQREAIAYESMAPEMESGEAVTIGDLEYAADLSKAKRDATLEVVRSKRGILSAIQTLANLSKEEAAFARTGPTG